MYISNLIITATCCFPVNSIVLKVVENSYRLPYQHSNIIESGGVGAGWRPELNNLEKVWGVALLFILSLFLDINNRFLDIRTSCFDLKKSISWYQKIDSWYQVIGLIFLYQEIGLIFFISSIFFSYQEMHFFLYQKSIFDITKYRINSKTAPPFYYLLDFFILDMKKTSIWVFDILSVRFFIKNSIFLYEKIK